METTEQQLNHGQDNLGETESQNSELAKEVDSAVLAVDFGDNRKIVPVKDIETMVKLYEAGLGKDSRVRAMAESGIASVFEGVAFDPENVRSQAFAIFEGETPVGSMAVVTAPKKWIAKQRYFQKEHEGIRVVDAHAISGPELPEFYIIPGWTELQPSHRVLLTRPGLVAFHGAIKTLENSAPDGTWMELVARGQLPPNKRKESFDLADKEVGSLIPFDEFPSDVGLFGQVHQESTSTVKIARLLGLSELENIGQVATLGPVFVKKIS
jgi:hypothetical protein